MKVDIISLDNTVIGDIDTTQILNNIGILYNYYKLKKIPPACYNYYIGYNEILNAYKIGKISKQKCKKLRQAKMGGDYACEYCPYLSLCLKQK